MASLETYDKQAERALLGSCLIHAVTGGVAKTPEEFATRTAIPSPAIDAARTAGITVASFYAPPHQLIFKAIEAVVDGGGVPDPVTVGAHMAERGDLDTASAEPVTRELLFELTKETSAVSNAKSYARIIVDYAHERHVRAELARAYEANGTWRSIVDDLTAEVDGWNATAETEGFFSDWEMVMDGELVGDPPTVGLRDDGVCALLYAGKLNNIIGESESGKSMIAQWFAVQEAKRGNHVIYLDFEDAATSVGDRFTEMGATMDELALIHYRRHDEPWTSVTLAVLQAQVAQYKPTYCVVDGVTNAMALEGKNPLDNVEVAQFYGKVPSMLRWGGAAAFMVDHVVKARQDRAPGAIGAQHKRAGIDGVSLMLRMKEPAGRNRVGFGWLTIDKDRPGFLREHAPDGKTIADVTIRSDGESIVVELAESAVTPVTKGQSGPRRTGFMARVSRVLVGLGDVGASGRELGRQVDGRNEWVVAAANSLVEEGYATTERKGAAIIYRSVKPFFESAPVDDRYEVDRDEPEGF